MKTILSQCNVGAVILANFFPAASTPIPLTGSGLLSVKSFNAHNKVPTASHLQLDVANEGERGLLARDPTDKDDNNVDSKPKRSPITIPHVFRPPAASSEPELKMTIPGATDHTCWGSVLNIVHLIDAAAERNTKLRGPRDTFVKELKTTASIRGTLVLFTRNIERLRPSALNMQETEGRDLETILDHIETAVKKHNEFKGDIKIPIGFFPNENLGMKVPYPENTPAVNSVKVIIGLLQSATGSNTEYLTDQLCTFRNTLVRHFKLNLPGIQRNHTRLTDAKFTACQQLVREAIARHNNNDWVKDNQFVIPEIPDDGNYYNPPPTQYEAATRIHMPQFFIPSGYKGLHLTLPRGDDNDGKESVKHILELMALVGGTSNLQASWLNFNRKLYDIKAPKVWGPLGEEGAEARKKAVAGAVKAHNKSQKEKKRLMKVLNPGIKRPA
ncbi:hypothetical protein H0H93_007512, partial [Arthromyces matolae]